jgi:hypothetical protein
MSRQTRTISRMILKMRKGADLAGMHERLYLWHCPCKTVHSSWLQLCRMIGLQVSLDFACHLACLLGVASLRALTHRQKQPHSCIPSLLA